MIASINNLLVSFREITLESSDGTRHLVIQADSAKVQASHYVLDRANTKESTFEWDGVHHRHHTLNECLKMHLPWLNGPREGFTRREA